MADLERRRRRVGAVGPLFGATSVGPAAGSGGAVARRPDLASAITCLEALERMAPEPSDEAEEADGPGLPREFGPYELIEEIGRGGMGVVYKARQKDLDRTVALKMILASHLASPEHVRRFQSEARAAARLRHAHIVPIHDVGQLHGQHYFTMEHIAGESLAQRIARGPIHVQVAARLVGAVARAVDHLHQQGLVHRDLKPSNILLDQEGEPYVTDFGLAKVFLGAGLEATATGVIAGTPSYMAPEQASGRGGEVGPAADVYSLGAILYELLTGQPPFREESPLDTLLDILRREPTPPRQLDPRLPRGLELICMKCLAKAPEQRYASAAAMADDLDRFARGEPLEVRPPRLGQRLAGWTRRQPALAWRLAALGVFYVVELANYTFGGVGLRLHEQISLLVAAWAGLSILCQQFLESRRWSIPRPIRLGTARLALAAGDPADCRRREQPSAGRVSAGDRGLGAVVSGAVCLVHYGVVACIVWGAGGGFLPLASLVAGAVRPGRQSPRDLRRGPGRARLGGGLSGAASPGLEQFLRPTLAVTMLGRLRLECG